MTKEELMSQTRCIMIDYGEFTREFDRNGIAGLYEWIDENFKCIKKGVNAHPYADVLHEWVEGAKMECGFTHDREIYTLHKDVISYFDRELYRIKPAELVYEWQWCVTMLDGDGSIYGFHTEEAINEIFPKQEKIKIGSSKRIRQ